jgi:hypothetical protein
MPWFAYAMIALFAAVALTCVANVGKEREPTEPGIAMMVVVVSALEIVGVILLARGAC